MQLKLKELSDTKSQYDTVNSKFTQLNDMSQKGEVLLTNRVKELQSEQEKMHAKLANEIF